jgi:hypothetical protein
MPKTIYSAKLGDSVVCDLCGDDYTERTDPGGFIFGSKAVCPTCEPQVMADVAQYGEQKYIRATCPPDTSFADFIRKWRGPDAKIEIKVL